nr:MAG: endonuclease [Thermoproteus sp. AZ2]
MLRCVERLVKPSARDAAAFINGKRRIGLVVVFCRCRGLYSGRASAELPSSNYLVVLKRDGALLVHGPDKSTPIIWNPPGSSTAAFVEGERLVIKSVRRHPLESVVLYVEGVEEVAALRAEASEAELRGSEKEIVDALVQRPDFIEPGLVVVGREVPTEAGHIDILAVDPEGREVVIEVKRDEADHGAVFQLQRYVESRRAQGREARGILVAADISPSAYDYLKRFGLKFVKIKPRELVEKLLNNNALKPKRSL